MILGGLFLLWKSIQEIWESLEGAEEGEHQVKVSSGYWMVLGQIAIIDIVFSLDFVITAVGMVDEVGVMVTAIVIAVGVMMFAAKGIGEFVDAHPNIKMLALSFLILSRGNLDLAPHEVDYIGVTAMQPGIGSGIDRFQGFGDANPDVTNSTDIDGTVTASVSGEDQVIYVGPGSAF